MNRLRRWPIPLEDVALCGMLSATIPLQGVGRTHWVHCAMSSSSEVAVDMRNEESKGENEIFRSICRRPLVDS